MGAVLRTRGTPLSRSISKPCAGSCCSGRERLPSMQQGWQRLEAWLREAEHPWKRAAGPLGACWCYLQEMEWEPLTIHRWRIGLKVYDILKAEDFHEVLFLTNRWVASRRHARMAAVDGGQGLHTGPDWKVSGAYAIKKADHLAGVALKTILARSGPCIPYCHLSEMRGPCHQETCLVGLFLVAVAWGTGATLVAVQTGPRLPAVACGILASCRRTLLGRGSPILDEALILTGVLLTGGSVLPKPLRQPGRPPAYSDLGPHPVHLP